MTAVTDTNAPKARAYGTPMSHSPKAVNAPWTKRIMPSPLR
jgi:hypothetical protein